MSLGLAAVLLVVKILLLPFHVDTPDELLRWLLRLALVYAADLCFVAALAAGCLALSALVRRWARPARVWRCSLMGVYYLGALYAILSLPMFYITLVPFSIRLLSFSGGPLMMASSIADGLSTALVLSLVGVPVLLLFAPRALTPLPWFRRGAPLKWQPVLGVLLVVAAYGAVSHAYIHAHWTDPNRWERRISQNPHALLLSSCVEEVLKEEPLTAIMYFSEADDEDFRAVEPPEPPAEFPFAYPAPGTERPRNVIVVFLESIAVEYLSLYGSEYETWPNLERMAEERNAVAFEDFYVQVPNSCKSLVALLCGVHPRPDWQLITRDYPGFDVPALPAVLCREGYRTCCLHSGFWAWRGRDRFLLERGVDTLIDAEYLPDEQINSWGVSDRAMFRAAMRWIDADRQRPFFLLAYTIETHHPYAVPDHPLDFDTGDKGLDRYLNSIRAADEQIAWLMGELEKRGLDESTLVVVTADHGEAFGQHGQRGHMFGIYEQNVHVPLVLFHPSLREAPRRVAGVRQQVDVPATVLHLLGHQPPAAWQGRNLFRRSEDDRAYFFCVGNDIALGLRDGDYKFHHHVSTGYETLFDLSRDPGEEVNLAERMPERCRQYRRRVGGFVEYQREFLERHERHLQSDR